MLSRVAENLYWMARYLERAENTARLINVNTFLQLDLPKKVRFGWHPLIEITGSEKLFKQLFGDCDERSAVKFLVGDERNPGSLLASLHMARENARTIRDAMPRETWEQINALYLFARGNLSKGLSQGGRFDFLKTLILSTQQITGLLAGTMTHDQSYEFTRMGRNLERADMTTRIIDVRSANLLPEVSVDLKPFENVQWMSVLKSLSGYQMYRREMQVNVRRSEVLKFLFHGKRFPRAFAHAVGEVESCLNGLPRNTSALRVVQDLKSLLNNSSPETLQQDELHAFIDELQRRLGELHAQIAATYFLAQDPGTDSVKSAKSGDA